MNSYPAKERKLLYKIFIKLKDGQQLLDIIHGNLLPNREVCVRSGLDDDFMFGIVVEVYEVTRCSDK